MNAPSSNTFFPTEDPRWAEARCWIYGASRTIAADSADGGAVAKRLSGFMAQWNAHGMPVTGQWWILHDRFLIVLQGPDGVAASGCSIDSMKAEILGLEADLQIQLLDSSRLFFRGPTGDIESVTRPDFKSLVREGRIGLDTEVFDTMVSKLGDLRPGVFSKPLRESWHLRLYENALAQATA